ncbi:MAG: FAD-dependent oxidoreductase [Balneolales bacterium]
MLGAGLAGLSLADSLNDKGHRVLVVDKGAIGSGASGTPVGLVNPATGRKANLSWEAETCHQVISNNLDKVQETVKHPFFSRSGVLRPAMDDKMYTHFRNAYERDNWPTGWCTWMSADEVRETNPYLVETNGGLMIHAGMSVRVPEYLTAYSAMLEKKGVTILSHQNYQLIPDGPHWQISSDQTGTLKSSSVVFAGGHAVEQTLYWRDMPVHPVKGQISRYWSSDRLSWEIPVAAFGYFAPYGENEFVTGGTYEHDFDDEQFDEKGVDILEGKVRKTMPTLLDKSTLMGQWAGVRASTPNRLPIIGPHKDQPNLHIFTGLGSKGLLYSKHVAELLAKYLVEGKDLPEELSTGRF